MRSNASLGPIVTATVTVPDLDEATGWYTRWLAYDIWAEGVVTGELAAAWLASGAGGSRYRLLTPGPRAPGGIRLVERRRKTVGSPLRVAGWRSLEICVADVRELRRRLEGSPFSIVGEPQPLDTNPTIVAMQAVGPGREMLYLTQTSDDTVFELPSATRPVDRMFIAVLSARDLERSQRFYVERFGAVGHLQATSIPLEAVNLELGLPLERAHPISAFQLAGRSLIEVDEHPGELRGEELPADDLPGGLAMVSFEHPDLDALDGLAGEPWTNDEPPYLGRRAALVIGPDGERIELVERVVR